MENTYKILILVAITLGAIIGVYSLDKWASDNGLNLETLKDIFPFGGHKGFRMKMMH